MTTYNFTANGHDFGNYPGDTLLEACDAFASDAGYKSWLAMVEQAEEVSSTGNDVEVREALDSGGTDTVDLSERATTQARAERYADSQQLWDEYIDPDATTPFDSITRDERVALALGVIVNNK